MAFGLKNQKKLDKKQRTEQAQPYNKRGHALTEDLDGFQDLFWS